MARVSPVQKFVQNAAPPVCPTTVETVVATLSGISTQTPDGAVILEGEVAMVIGASGTGVNLRVRRGVDITGVLVGSAIPLSAAAGNSCDLEIQVQDFPGEMASGTYVLTVAQNSATANGVPSLATLSATY